METKNVTIDLKKNLEVLELKNKATTKIPLMDGFNPKLDTAKELLN